MRYLEKIIIVCVAITAIASACGPKNSVYLEFDSGGKHHISGIGSWSVQLMPDRKMKVERHIGDKTDKFGPFEITADEDRIARELLAKLRLSDVPSSDRLGVPDEVKYSFVERTGKKEIKREYWQNDARDRPEFNSFLDLLSQFITKYCRTAAVF